MYWLNRLNTLILEEKIDFFFQGLNRKEAVLVTVKNIWNDRFQRNDQINFERLEFILDENGKPEQEPPHIIIREMGGGETLELRQAAFKTFKKLIDNDN